MLDLLVTVIKWFIDGVTNILKFIVNIPTYFNYIAGYIHYLPNSLIAVFTLCLTVFIVIKIKRLIL